LKQRKVNKIKVFLWGVGEEEERVFPSNKLRAFETQFGGFLFHPDCKKEKRKNMSEIGPEFTIY
jgi:hypothetical protein